MRGSEFHFDVVNLLHYDLNKISLDRGGSHIDSPEWIKNKKATINPQNKTDDKCFQYALTVALNHEKTTQKEYRKLNLLLININYEKKEMIPLTKKEEKNHNKQKICHICRKEFNTDDSDKKYHKVTDHCHYTGKYRGAAHDICNLRYKIPKEIPVVFHNGSTYDYHFIIKNLAEEFEGEFECLGENTENILLFWYQSRKKL